MGPARGSVSWRRGLRFLPRYSGCGLGYTRDEFPCVPSVSNSQTGFQPRGDRHFGFGWPAARPGWAAILVLAESVCWRMVTPAVPFVRPNRRSGVRYPLRPSISMVRSLTRPLSPVQDRASCRWRYARRRRENGGGRGPVATESQAPRTGRYGDYRLRSARDMHRGRATPRVVTTSASGTRS